MKLDLTTWTAQKDRPYQEDRMVTVTFEYGTFLAIFDGHGGNEAANCCAEVLTEIIERVWKARFNSQFSIVDMSAVFHFLHEATKDFFSGTTASIVFIPSNGKKAVVGVLGDSPILIQMMKDGQLWSAPEHNVRSNKQEADKAETRGGWIVGGYLYTFWSGIGLQLSRALGDKLFANVLDRHPEVFEIPLAEGSFVLLASDGLFDPSHQSNPMPRIAADIRRGDIAKDLVDNAPQDDNVTAILVKILPEKLGEENG